MIDRMAYRKFLVSKLKENGDDLCLEASKLIEESIPLDFIEEAIETNEADPTETNLQYVDSLECLLANWRFVS